MKLYPSSTVEMSYQNYGSTWLGILRGPTEAVNEVFNGLYNYCASNGDVEFQDHLRMLGTFWTSRRAMRRFFFNRYFMPRCMGNRGKRNGKLVRQAMRYALAQLEVLAKTSHEVYRESQRDGQDIFICGTIAAERPDSDMKDAILSHAFADKGESELDSQNRSVKVA